MRKVWFSTMVYGIGGTTDRLVQKLRGSLQGVASRSQFAFARPAGSPGGTAAMFMDSMTRFCS